MKSNKSSRLKFALKGFFAFISLGFLIVFAIYSFAWFSFTKRAELYISHYLSNSDMKVSGQYPKFSGYPLVPHTEFKGEIEHPSGLKISTPVITYLGFPAARQIQSIEAPEGIIILSPFLERVLNFEYAYLQVRMPSLTPTDDKKETITNWQKREDPFIIQQIVLKSGNVYARGSGFITLDDKLQLNANIDARVVGMETLFTELEKQHGEKTMALARNFYNMMSKKDEVTGEKYFETTLKIQNRGIYFGPMRISGLPELKWRD